MYWGFPLNTSGYSVPPITQGAPYVKFNCGAWNRVKKFYSVVSSIVYFSSIYPFITLRALSVK